MTMVMTMVMISTIKVIIVMTLRGPIQDLCTISLLLSQQSPARALKWPVRSRVQITCNASGAYHVQHVCQQ